MIKGGFNPYSKSFSKKLFKTFTYKSKKRSKSRKGKGKKNKTRRKISKK